MAIKFSWLPSLLLAVVSTTRNCEAFAFAPPPLQLPSRQHGFSRSSRGLEVRNTRDVRISSEKHTRLYSTPAAAVVPISSMAAWAVAHCLAGATGTPIVLTATKPGKWYSKINLPSWTPPNWMFAPVWTTLYALMGISFARILSKSATSSTYYSILWGIHMALNLSWAPIFFGFVKIKLGFYWNCLIVGTLAYTMKVWYAVDPVASYLLAPYLLWTTFATVLNWDICRRNPSNQGYDNVRFYADLQRLQAKAAQFADGK